MPLLDILIEMLEYILIEKFEYIIIEKRYRTANILIPMFL